MDEERRLNEIHQMFNIAEKISMEFIADFLKEPHNIIFKDDIPITSNPIILKPIKEYNDQIYFKIELVIKSIDDLNNEARIAKINEMLVYQDIKDVIGFVLFCINNVYTSIKTSGLINNAKIININPVLKPETWGFHAEYKHESTIKKEFYEQSINNFDNMLNNDTSLTDIKKNNIKIAKAKLIDENDLVCITNEIQTIETKINNKLKNNNFIAINIIELTADQLPK